MSNKEYKDFIERIKSTIENVGKITKIREFSKLGYPWIYPFIMEHRN